ncbi:MAG: hypothetical protein WBX25_37365, partial [Rhodomicrobium sp.]
MGGATMLGLRFVSVILGVGFFAVMVACAGGGAAVQDKFPVKIVLQLGHSGYVNAVAFSPNGRSALSGSLDRTLKLWDGASGRELKTFQGHLDAVLSVAFSPDGRSALSGSRDNTLKLWDVVSGRELKTFQGHSDGVYSVTFSPDGRSALSGSN